MTRLTIDFRYQPENATRSKLVQRGFFMPPNPPSVSLRRPGRPTHEFLLLLGAYLIKHHEVPPGVFVGNIRGRHNFVLNQNKALLDECQNMHLEGVFHGIF